MPVLGLIQTLLDGLLNRGERGIGVAMETFGFYELPQPFNEVKIRRITGKPAKRNPEAVRLGHDIAVALVAGVIQNDGDGMIGETLRQAFEQRDDTLAINVGVVGNRDHFPRDGVKRTQDIKALTAGGRRQEDARQTLEVAEPGTQDEVGRVDEQDVACARLCFF